jgi:hypothetical protein
MMPMAKGRYDTGGTVACPLIVDVSISPPHCTPEAGQSGVQKAQHRDSHILIIRLNNAHPVNFHLIILAVIKCYETDSISSFDKLPADERLLHFRPPDVSNLRIV